MVSGYGLIEKISDKNKYLTSENSCITDSIKHIFGEIRIDLCNSLPIEKIFIFHNVMIFIKSVVNKNKNNYYFYIVLEIGSYKDKSDTRHF